MRISDVLRSKGNLVVTVSPDATVQQLLQTLAEHKIGAVVVSGDGATVDGIVSERDIVRALANPQLASYTGDGSAEAIVCIGGGVTNVVGHEQGSDGRQARRYLDRAGGERCRQQRRRREG